VHVQRDTSLAKFWLDPIRIAVSYGFRRSEIRQIERIILENHDRLSQAWNEYFSE
jgi:hypothetical protein